MAAADPPTRPGWDAATYHQVSGVQEAWGRELAEAFDWRGDETVLDAGCGTGRVARYLLKRIPTGRLVAVDADARMIETAGRTLAAEIENGRARLVQSDLLEFSPETPVDVVFSNAVFHWIADHDRLWARCRQWLRPRGWLWAQGGGQGNLEPELALAREVASRPPYAGRTAGFVRDHHFAKPEATRRRLIRAGLVASRVDLEPKTTPLEEPEHFEPFVRTVILRHYQAVLGPELFEAFVGEWLRAHLRRFGPRLHYVRLNVRARRPTDGRGAGGEG